MKRKTLNCWEYKKCGRQHGGDNVDTDGVCESASDLSYTGINAGKCAGRFCWAVSGSFSNGNSDCSLVKKIESCTHCDFYQIVRAEEGTVNLRTKFLRFVPIGGTMPFISEMPIKYFKTGERIISQGESGEGAYIIKRGACLSIVEKNGMQHPVAHRSEGDIIDMMALFTGEPSGAHVIAETDVTVWVLNKTHFEDISRKDPDLLDFLSEVVAERFDSKRPTAERTIGDYVATDIIGRGGYSIVYKGVHVKTDQQVVIKMLRHNMAMQDEFIESFKNEAILIEQFDHENIVNVYDCVECFKTVFIMMEYVKGQALNEILKYYGKLSSMTAIDYLIKICEGLDYAHKRGVLHRDVNPSNIIIYNTDQVKLIDFGLACPIGIVDEDSLGTLAYVAPEQISAETIDQRTDIYALGITAYEIVTGEKPFPEDDYVELIRMHEEDDIPDPGNIVPNLPVGLRDFIVTAGRCDPEERYPDMSYAIEALKGITIFDNKKKCWHFMKCGREPGGANNGKEGVCPAADRIVLKGLNQSTNSGQACWVIAGTFCNQSVQGTFAQKMTTCMDCDFYKTVHSKERATYSKINSAEMSAYTHIGNTRKANEDRYLYRELDDQSLLVAVADGMGGEVAGDFAAEITSGELASLHHVEKGNEKNDLCRIACEIDLKISDMVESKPELEGMGTTLVCVLFRDKYAHWLNVGDSRLYLYRDKTVIQITEDQTLGRFLVEEGEITIKELQTHHSKNFLEQCIGCGFVEPVTGGFELKQNDLLILTTDGLHSCMTNKEMELILNQNTGIENCAKSLVDMALEKDGTDNITIVITNILSLH